MKKKGGFTLVELLVVIAIIALLMSILMPALARVRKQAKAVLCMSNLKQWGSIFAMYIGDYQGKFLEGWSGGTQTAPLSKHYWMEALRPYYGNEGDLRCCPMATIPGSETGHGAYGGGSGNATFVAWGIADGGWAYMVAGDYGSYGGNAFVNSPPPSVTDIQGHPTTNNWRTPNVKGAANIPLLGDNQWIDAWPHHTEAPPEYEGQHWQTDHAWSMLRVCINRHDGFVNWVFCDFTVRKIGLKQLWKVKWNRTFNFDDGPTSQEWPEWMRPFKDYK
jgi:prepilin-type N-terminal cleavage/methylation domain-containing protein